MPGVIRCGYGDDSNSRRARTNRWTGAADPVGIKRKLLVGLRKPIDSNSYHAVLHDILSRPNPHQVNWFA